MYIYEKHAWTNLIKRCTDPSATGYQEYGARGITVCKEWSNFEQFLKDMGARPSNKHSIDRINNDLGYAPGNCRWATREEQANNRSDNLRIEYLGEALTASQWAKKLGLARNTIYNRYHQGLREEALFAPSTRKPRGNESCYSSGSRTPEYSAWKAMKQRCTNPRSPVWHRYGAVGVTVCPRWVENFGDFLQDMGLRPSPDHSLMRLDKSLPYGPENCCWATREDQMRNSTATRKISYAGEVLTLIDWSRRTGVASETIRSRLRSGKSMGAALGFEKSR
jgi:hypothetical protein